MAKNTSKGYRKGSVSDRAQVQNRRTGLWTRRDSSTGQFTSVKKTGGSFKGLRKED
jgi:hypothetical protein